MVDVEVDKSLDLETLKKRVADYEQQIEESTAAVDLAAENEQYDEAERL